MQRIFKVCVGCTGCALRGVDLLSSSAIRAYGSHRMMDSGVLRGLGQTFLVYGEPFFHHLVGRLFI